MKKIISILTLLSMLLSLCLSLTACASVKASEDLMRGITPTDDIPYTDVSQNSSAVMDFALNILRESNSENTLVSPLSLLLALGMTMNGADGETLGEMEEAIGMTKDELNSFSANYLRSLNNDDDYDLKTANAIWFKNEDRFTVNKNFLQANADYYNAGAYLSPFDNNTLNDINNFVKKETDGTIESILNEIDPLSMLYIVNAISFDGEWEKVYKNNSFSEDVFTTASGDVNTVEYMISSEEDYINTDKGVGIIKHYKGERFAFVALLPRSEHTVDELISSLTADKISEMLDSVTEESVKCYLPKFDCEFSLDMKNVFEEMGIKTVFTGNADLSPMVENHTADLRVSKILHKTNIKVDGHGTQAGAASAVEVVLKGVQKPDTVIKFNRPFFYMIIDTESRIPIFTGTADNIGK